jgi:methionyl-tRNA synthetase
LGDSIDDLDLNVEEFVNRTNAELVNNITNLISRSIGFLNKRLDSRLGEIPKETQPLVDEILSLVDRASEEYRGLRFNLATRHILAISDIANNYVQKTEPWALMKSDPEAARNCLTFAVNCIKIITVLLKPVLPSYCRKVEEILGVGELKWDHARFDMENVRIGTFEKLLDRLEPGSFEKLIEASRESLQAAEAPRPPQVPEFKEEVTIEDFARLDLRAGLIMAAETVEGSDKLLKLTVDLGRETRTVFAGIKGSYEPEDLVGKTVAVIANLKPRKMRFGVSQGMVLAAVGKDGKVTVCEFAGDVPPGTPIS